MKYLFFLVVFVVLSLNKSFCQIILQDDYNSSTNWTTIDDINNHITFNSGSLRTDLGTSSIQQSNARIVRQLPQNTTLYSNTNFNYDLQYRIVSTGNNTGGLLFALTQNTTQPYTVRTSNSQGDCHLNSSLSIIVNDTELFFQSKSGIN